MPWKICLDKSRTALLSNSTASPSPLNNHYHLSSYSHKILPIKRFPLQFCIFDLPFKFIFAEVKKVISKPRLTDRYLNSCRWFLVLLFWTELLVRCAYLLLRLFGSSRRRMMNRSISYSNPSPHTSRQTLIAGLK